MDSFSLSDTILLVDSDFLDIICMQPLAQADVLRLQLSPAWHFISIEMFFQSHVLAGN